MISSVLSRFSIFLLIPTKHFPPQRVNNALIYYPSIVWLNWNFQVYTTYQSITQMWPIIVIMIFQLPEWQLLADFVFNWNAISMALLILYSNQSLHLTYFLINHLFWVWNVRNFLPCIKGGARDRTIFSFAGNSCLIFALLIEFLDHWSNRKKRKEKSCDFQLVFRQKLSAKTLYINSKTHINNKFLSIHIK